MTNRLGIESEIESDCAPLNHMVEELLEGNISVHTVRDITRGGLATVANELAVSSSVRIELEEGMIPVSDIVQGFTGILGLDPLTMGNEGKMIIAVSPKDAEKAVGILRRNKYGRNAVAAGQVLEGKAYTCGQLLADCAVSSRLGEKDCPASAETVRLVYIIP